MAPYSDAGRYILLPSTGHMHVVDAEGTYAAVMDRPLLDPE
ncbi:MAG: hypothetical protein ACU0CO_05670 [Shimia sp.]